MPSVERCAAIWATKHDESSDLPLNPEVVAGAVKKEFALMRQLQVYMQCSSCVASLNPR